jgi:hypothetical protein
MAAAPRDMTPGEIEVRLDSLEKNILAEHREIKSNMVTTGVFDARLMAHEQQVARLESDHRKWVEESTAAHVRLEADSKARHAETSAEMKALETRVNTRFEKQEERAYNLEQTAKAQKNNKWQAIGIAILSSALSIIAAVIITLNDRILGGG